MGRPPRSKPSTATRSTTNSDASSATGCSSSTRSATCPLERQAANLLFALVARRYERGSIIVTSNRGFEAWGEILGDAMVAAALIDRLVHHENPSLGHLTPAFRTVCDATSASAAALPASSSL